MTGLRRLTRLTERHDHRPQEGPDRKCMCLRRMLVESGASMKTRFVAALLPAAASSSCRNGADAVAAKAGKAPAEAALSASGAPHPEPTGAVASASSAAPAVAEAPPPSPPAPPALTSDFCIEGIHALDEETCYVLPAARTSELLLYFHGIVPPEKTSQQKSYFETVVQKAAGRAGVAALVPRGELGLAPKGHERWWGWPTSALDRVPEQATGAGQKDPLAPHRARNVRFGHVDRPQWHADGASHQGAGQAR